MEKRIYLCVILWSCWTYCGAVHQIKSHATLDTSLSLSAGKERTKRATVQLTAAEQETLLDIHNEFRSMQGASNMLRMYWHDVLAQMAQGWSDGCVFVHGDPPTPEKPFFKVGQNMFATGGGSRINLTAAVKFWYDEIADYTYSTKECTPGKSCLHYTAVVWAETEYVGCAYTHCPTLASFAYPDADFLVCNYGPAGNYGDEDIFRKGEPCRTCEVGNSWCNGGLCDNRCASDSPPDGCECQAACQNCGTYNANNCSCTCPTGWDLVDCSLTCGDHHEWCGGNGWPVSWCTTGDWAFRVSRLCHSACGHCEAGTLGSSNCPAVGPGTMTGSGGGGGNGVGAVRGHLFVVPLLVIFALMLAQE